ncbi:MAG: amino acid ABC transporter substrate-binding protein [Pseudomonadota bacterium]
MRYFLLSVLVLFFGFTDVRADAIDQIVRSETIRIGVRASTPPFSFVDDEGVPRGLAVQLCQRVVTSLERQLGVDKIEIEYVKVDSLTRFDVLENREVDLHCGPMTITLARREIVDFSIPYFIDGIGAALRRGGVQQVADLNGQPIGALAGTTSVALAESLSEATGSKLIEFASYEAGLRALGDGMIDIYFGDHGVLQFQLDALKQKNRLIPIKVSDEQLTYEPYGIAMPAGERRLRLEVDRALSEAYRSQEIFVELERAFGAFEVTDLTTIIYGVTALPD